MCLGHPTLSSHVYAPAVIDVLEEARGTHAAHSEVHVAELVGIPYVKACGSVGGVEAGSDARASRTRKRDLLSIFVLGGSIKCCRVLLSPWRSDGVVFMDHGAVERALWCIEDVVLHRCFSSGGDGGMSPLCRRIIAVKIGAGYGYY
jgi:hypothetical protein